MATRLTDRFGEQFIVDSRPGAGSTTGVANVVRANPDGYMLLMMSPAYAGSVPLY
jgi:tripartite-type tricarboxylate transporter receptor subunit TctC